MTNDKNGNNILRTQIVNADEVQPNILSGVIAILPVRWLDGTNIVVELEKLQIRLKVGKLI